MKKKLFYLILCIFISKNSIAAEKIKKMNEIKEQIKINKTEYERQCKQILLTHEQNTQRLERTYYKQLEVLQMYMMIAHEMLDTSHTVKVTKACSKEKEKFTGHFVKKIEESHNYAMKSLSVVSRMNDKKNLLLLQQLTP